MSRTDLDAETLARSLRAMAGDGSIEWTYEPMQTSVLLDIADLLDENAKLRVERDEWHRVAASKQDIIDHMRSANAENVKLRELVRQMYPRANAFLQMGVQLGCNDSMSYDWQLQMRELGVEVDG